MDARFNRISLVTGIFGILLLAIGGYFKLPALSIVGIVFLAYGLVYYVLAKGRDPKWAILAVFGPRGLATISDLTDKTVQKKQNLKCMIANCDVVELAAPDPPYRDAFITRTYCPHCDIAFIEVSGNYENLESIVQLRRQDGELALAEDELPDAVARLGIDWNSEQQKIRIHVKNWLEKANEM